MPPRAEGDQGEDRADPNASGERGRPEAVQHEHHAIQPPGPPDGDPAKERALLMGGRVADRRHTQDEIEGRQGDQGDDPEPPARLELPRQRGRLAGWAPPALRRVQPTLIGCERIPGERILVTDRRRLRGPTAWGHHRGTSPFDRSQANATSAGVSPRLTSPFRWASASVLSLADTASTTRRSRPPYSAMTSPRTTGVTFSA